MTIEAQPQTNTILPTGAKYLAGIPILLSCVMQSIVLVYVYVFLWSFHLLYSSSIRAIMFSATRPSSSSQLEALLGGVTKICYATLTTGILCTCVGVYIAQNSYESGPGMWGVILMIAGVDALLNILAVLATIHATVLPPNVAHFDDRSVRRIARILAVPVSSLIWCLIITIVSIVSYCAQASAPQLDLTSDLQLLRKPDPCQSSDYAEGQTAPLHLPSLPNLPSLPPIVRHTSPLLARVGLVFMAIVLVLRFLFVVYSTTRLQDIFNLHLASKAMAGETYCPDSSSEDKSPTDIPHTS
ncbi:hypothetical protein BDY19DRAFT_937462 [Irpex rosettiformis]|uniref:Uncharacterized protein n=1 Tax=Irpex rosettiformis TaxID=378272 RepID=A0ACB8U961_9APHY|nr:hypothetical protein BDY19DRAFT_937462 [Irpex rosettiformis]